MEKTKAEPKLDDYILRMMSRHKLKRDLGYAETDDDSCDLSSTEFALSLQHVLEQIFQSLPTSTLLQCRLVCHRWNFFAISPLQNQVRQEFDHSGSYRGAGAGSKKSLREFTNLLQQHSRIFPCSPFPCTKCSIEKSCDKFWFFRNDKMLNKLFTYHGANLREVSLSIFNHHGRRNNKPFLKMILDQIQNLILYQIPNVHTLELRVHVYKQEPSNLSEFDKNLRSIKTSTKSEVKVNNKLKILHLPRLFESSDFSVAVTIFKMIVELAPNLTEILTNKPEDYTLLLGPLYRFDLIKKLSICVREVRDIELFEKLITHAINSKSSTPAARTGLKLREISIKLVEKTSTDPASLFASSEIKARIAKVINAALESSWDSLNAIYWGGVTVLRDLEFPPVMPNVRKIELGDPFRIGPGQMIFPYKFCWAETFPNLGFLGLYNHGFLDNSSVLTRRFNRFNNNNYNHDNNARMDNETLVEVSFLDFINSLRGELCKRKSGSAIRIGVRNGSREATSDKLLRIKTLFPSAQVQDMNSTAGGGS